MQSSTETGQPSAAFVRLARAVLVPINVTPRQSSLNHKCIRKNKKKRVQCTCGRSWWSECLKKSFKQVNITFVLLSTQHSWAAQGDGDAVGEDCVSSPTFSCATRCEPRMIQLGFWLGSAGTFKSCLFYAMWPNVKRAPLLLPSQMTPYAMFVVNFIKKRKRRHHEKSNNRRFFSCPLPFYNKMLL